MLISVVIPTRHRNDLLSLCLKRLFPGAQALPAEQYEVIVTDDGVRPIAQQLIAEKFPWARWVAGPRRGPAANRNNGARHARGEFIAFVDDDCLPAAGWLAAYVQAIRPGIDVYEGKTTCEAGISSPLYHAPINLTGGWLWSCNMMVRAELFRQLGGFDEAFPCAHMEDVDFRERIKARGLPFAFVPEAVVDHPPRRLPFGSQLARLEQCRIIFQRKWNAKPLSLRAELLLVARARLQSIARQRKSFDSITAAWSLLSELCVLTACYHRWLAIFSQLNVRVHDEAGPVDAGGWKSDAPKEYRRPSTEGAS